MIKSARIGPGHYEILHGSVTLGWLFYDAVRAGQGDGEPWRFSPLSTLLGAAYTEFSAPTKREALAMLRAAGSNGPEAA